MRYCLRLVKVVLDSAFVDKWSQLKGAQGNCVVKGAEAAGRMTYWGNHEPFHMTVGQRVSRTAQKGPQGLRQGPGNFPEASSVGEELGPSWTPCTAVQGGPCTKLAWQMAADSALPL